MYNKEEPLSLPVFTEKLRAYARVLPDETYRRYSKGYLPKALRFLIEHPELLAALYKDVKTRKRN